MRRGGDGLAVEAYRRIRRNILEEQNNPDKLCISITSAHIGDGKTFNCASIAVPFAWAGKRVLLVDADVLKPNVLNKIKL